MPAEVTAKELQFILVLEVDFTPRKPANIFLWHEDTLPDMAHMHEDYDFNQ